MNKIKRIYASPSLVSVQAFKTSSVLCTSPEFTSVNEIDWTERFDAE